MTTRNMAIARTILEQLGGNKFCSMVGAYDIIAIEYGLSLKFKMCRKINLLEIKLMPSDTYRVIFSKYSKRTGISKVVEQYEDMYCDDLQDLFTAVTGLYTYL